MAGIGERATGEIIRLSFRFERLFPQLIKFYLGRKLRQYKKKGVITDYKIKAGRKGRYHYTFEIDLYQKIMNGGETVE